MRDGRRIVRWRNAENWQDETVQLNDTDEALAPIQGNIYKVAVASIIGSVIEQFDFLVTGVIAASGPRPR
jgi:hypothetical protein